LITFRSAAMVLLRNVMLDANEELVTMEHVALAAQTDQVMITACLDTVNWVAPLNDSSVQIVPIKQQYSIAGTIGAY